MQTGGSQFVYARHESSDFEELAARLAGLNQSFEQLSPGRFQGSVELAMASGIRLFGGRFNQVICSRGQPPRDQFVLSPVTLANSRSIFRGQTLSVGQLNLVSPGDETNHQTQAEGYDNILLMIGRERLERESERILGRAIGDSTRGQTGLSMDPTGCARLDRLMREALGRMAAGEWESAQRLLERAIELTVESLAGADLRPERERRPANPQRLVARAGELFRERRDTPLSTASVCDALHISERTLRNAFRDTLGISPMQFYKIIRLNAVRRELRGDPGTILAAARRWGFRHPGEFALDYHRLFGEKPSETFRGPKGFEILPAAG